MSSKRSTGKDQSEKIRKGEIDSSADSLLRDSPCARSAGIPYTKPPKANHERPLTSSNRYPQSEKSDNPRAKSSRSPGQKPPSAAQNRRVKSSQDGRTSTDVEGSAVERRRTTYDDEEAESTLPKRTSENKTKSPTTRPLSRPSQKEQGQAGRRFGKQQQQPYVLESDLRRGDNYYLYCLGKIYDVSDMRRRKEMQYWNLLARQRQLGFHSAKECEVYMRYLSRPRTADIYSTPSHSSKSRTRSTEGRRGRKEETDGRSGVASDGKERTTAVNEEKDEKGSSGDYKVKAVRSKTVTEPRSASSKKRPVSSMTSERRPVSSKTNLVNSKTSEPSSKTRLDRSKEVKKREADNQRSISRDEVEDEETKKKGSNEETSDEESETPENDADKTRHIRNLLRDKDRKNEGEQKSSNVLTPKAAEVTGSDGDEEETSDGDASEGRSSTQRDGGSKPVAAVNRDGRNTEVASSDNEGGSDIGGR